VGNVSFEATEDALYDLFGPCGDLINVKLLRGKAFVKFSTGDALGKALALNGSECEGRRLRIEETGQAKPQTERDPTSTTIFVGGISYYSNEEVIAEHFKDCGEIKMVRMPLNED
jgi:RNA recognition motif-containing protein